MAIAGSVNSGPIEGQDDRSQKITAELAKLDRHAIPERNSAGGRRSSTSGAAPRGSTFPDGIPIYVDPLGLQEAEKTMTSPVTFDLKQVAAQNVA